jgi:hypothetical protein
MSRFRQAAVAAAAASALASSAQVSSPPAPQGNALTIYSTAQPGAVSADAYRTPGRVAVAGYAMVRQERTIDLARGRGTVRFSDVAGLIDPTTVVFESLTDPRGTAVAEQNYQFDLVSTEKLLQRYIDRTITVDQVRGQATESFSGTLLSTQGGLVLRNADGAVQVLPHNAGVKLPSLPGGLITRPTLVWDIDAQRSGAHRTRVSYMTGGITWWSDYNVVYNEGANANSCKLDVGAWVSIVNQSGAGYPDAKLKLVAGDVQRATPASVVAKSSAGRMADAREEKAKFDEKEFFEYHLYTLNRPTSLPDNSTKQIELFPVAPQVPCEKALVYYGRPPGQWSFLGSPATDRNYGVVSNRKVDVYLMFRNAEANGMGMPLPSGRVRVSKLDPADRTLEFIGEDTIDHTPRNEKVTLKLGSAFDVVGERRQMDFTVDTNRRTMREDIEVRLRNQKKERVTVHVKETLYRWINGRVTNASHEHIKEDARTVMFPVSIAPGEEAVVRYTASYSW